jgi:hypothetical protein
MRLRAVVRTVNLSVFGVILSRVSTKFRLQIARRPT